MKKITLLLMLFIGLVVNASATDLSSLTWAQVCSGGMGDAWYGTAEAISVADIVLDVQKNNGGWMKNDQLHKLTDAEYTALKNAKSEHSCFDNYSTTQEMRFLVRVYNATKEQKYLDAFKKALDLIITAGQNKKGGWGQYWPDSDDGSYQNYITFNDDLMTNMMKMLQDVYENQGSFEGLVDEDTRTKCKTAFDNALQCVLNCQIDDNGVKAAWCAQHDPDDFLPAEGRPHEEPSVSAYESSTLLSYLMTLESPSDELKACIRSAVSWLSNHKYKTDSYIEDVKDDSGATIDRKISAKAGSNVWGRFIQIGGESGKKVYQKFWNKLYNRGKKRAHHATGFVYYEYQILEESYDSTKAYQPIFSVYSNDYPELFYRHLYNYEDTPNITDKHGQDIITSLPAANRKSYQYLGSWCDNLINNEYTAWEAKIKREEEAGDYTLYALSADNATCASSDVTYTFNNGFTITNNKSKGYGTGKESTIKYSNGTQYTIAVPENLSVGKISFWGYNNYDGTDAYISEFNGTTCSATDYVFPQEDEGRTAYHTAENVITLASPQTGGNITFTLGGKQCCLILNVYAKEATGINEIKSENAKCKDGKYLTDKGIVIVKDNNRYNTLGQKQK